MKTLLTALIFILSTTLIQAQQAEKNPITSFYFIRHAEKNTSNPADKDPNLITEGILRAARWSSVMDHIPFETIYSTDYNRTRNTAHPIAEKKNLPLTLYNPKNFDQRVFRKENRGKTVLIVGHSNTVPSMVNAFIGQDLYKQIDDKNYSNLYIINITESGEIIHQLLAID